MRRSVIHYVLAVLGWIGCGFASVWATGPEAEVASGSGCERPFAKAMWVWEVKELLPSPKRQDEFFAFCGEQGIDEIFLQAVFSVNRDRRPITCELTLPDKFRRFIRRCTENGIKVHALDGYPEHALRGFGHDIVQAQVRAIIDFNRESASEERFYGIHLDNEPHQLFGFDGPERENILRQLIEANSLAMETIREMDGDVVYGIDIPMWFDTAETPCDVTWNGVRQDAARHLIDVCDNIGIMDYRTKASGPDSIIENARNEIEHADRAGKKIYIGVETFRYKPMAVTFVYGMPIEEWRSLDAAKQPLLLASNIREFRGRNITDGKRRYIGLAEPIPLKNSATYRMSLEQLHRVFGALRQGREADLDAIRADAQAMIEANPEYVGFEEIVRRDADGRTVFAGFKTTEVMPDTITFAGSTRQAMHSVLREVADHYCDHPGFAGFAIHYYTTYRDLPDY